MFRAILSEYLLLLLSVLHGERGDLGGATAAAGWFRGAFVCVVVRVHVCVRWRVLIHGVAHRPLSTLYCKRVQVRYILVLLLLVWLLKRAAVEAHVLTHRLQLLHVVRRLLQPIHV